MSVNYLLLTNYLRFFMPSKYHPEYRYIRIVRPLRVHLFTLIQVVLIGVLWGVKSSPVSIAFPFFLVLCVPIRNYVLPKIFTKKELHELDNETLGMFLGKFRYKSSIQMTSTTTTMHTTKPTQPTKPIFCAHVLKLNIFYQTLQLENATV